MDKSRRAFIQLGLFGSMLSVNNLIHAEPDSILTHTPWETEGPFYPIKKQKDKDFDLTQIEGSSESALGDVIYIEGKILNSSGEPIEDATVDLWQANAAGKYRHIRDANPAPIDPNFQGWAIVPSGASGDFKFKTIMPGPYPARGDWWRPPHIHFKVSAKGYINLTTQMYFPDHELNKRDFLIQRKKPDLQELMTAIQISKEPQVFKHQIVLQEA